MTPNRTRNVVTLRDIAEACHVSINTVSHALSDKADISEETKRRIRKKAKELGYIRNRTATSLRFQSTHTVTLIVSDISNPLFAIMAKKIEQRLSQEGYALFIMNTESNAEAEYAAVVSAIGNHDEGTGVPVNAVAAAMILADKADVRRSRVREKDPTTFDIHDRVNYSVKKSALKINEDKTIVKLKLTVDTKYGSVMEYFEIFMQRMVLCRKAAEKLGLQFKLIINEQQLI